jgi:hypothetical protein
MTHFYNGIRGRLYSIFPSFFPLGAIEFFCENNLTLVGQIPPYRRGVKNAKK